MKKENLRLKDMDQYITKTPLNMIEANKVFEMEHDGQRNFDIPFVYLAINTIKSLEKKGYDISKLPKIFLNRISALSFDDAANLINIMFFLEDLDMNDIYKAIMSFYDFFNDDVDYDDDRLNMIKTYITFDNDLLSRIFRTILMIDINLLAGPDNIKFFEYYYKVDPTILMNHFNENKMNFDENFNKNLFKSQLSYIRFYIEQKTIQK